MARRLVPIGIAVGTLVVLGGLVEYRARIAENDTRTALESVVRAAVDDHLAPMDAILLIDQRMEQSVDVSVIFSDREPILPKTPQNVEAIRSNSELVIQVNAGLTLPTGLRIYPRVANASIFFESGKAAKYELSPRME
ncbi:MAG: hypothetical protein M3R13_01125 [Armatimonadota bacterium]|nr:hypothetical protein [Armatimonadota bacterium]